MEIQQTKRTKPFASKEVGFVEMKPNKSYWHQKEQVKKTTEISKWFK